MAKLRTYIAKHTNGDTWTGQANDAPTAVVFGALVHGWPVGDAVFVITDTGLLGQHLTVPTATISTDPVLA